MADNENVELEVEDLEQVSGGAAAGGLAGGALAGDLDGTVKCKKCGGTNVTDAMGYAGPCVKIRYTCHDCGYTWDDSLPFG